MLRSLLSILLFERSFIDQIERLFFGRRWSLTPLNLILCDPFLSPLLLLPLISNNNPIVLCVPAATLYHNLRQCLPCDHLILTRHLLIWSFICTCVITLFFEFGALEVSVDPLLGAGGDLLEGEPLKVKGDSLVLCLIHSDFIRCLRVLW